MYKRTVKTPDTFGMLKTTAARQRARARGDIAAETGRHAGGPCPAVALATLAGRPYAWAFTFLNRETGYTGRGEYREALEAAAARLFGRPVSKTGRAGSTVGRTAAKLDRTANGFIYCRGHVMPVRNGRVLNASARHLNQACEGVTLFDIVEVTE